MTTTLFESSSDPRDLKFAIEVLSGIKELGLDSAVSGLHAQLQREREERRLQVEALEAEVSRLVRRLHAAKQTVEDLAIENEWLHSLCSSSGDSSDGPSPGTSPEAAGKDDGAGSRKKAAKAVSGRPSGRVKPVSKTVKKKAVRQPTKGRKRSGTSGRKGKSVATKGQGK